MTQLAKLRMNFLGIHCYPGGRSLRGTHRLDGIDRRLRSTGPGEIELCVALLQHTRKRALGAHPAKKTSDFSFGAAQLFESDDWAPPVMAGHCPLPVTPGDCNEVFNRAGLQFREAFTFARQLGIKTAMGTETPMTMPKALQERLKAQGKNPADPAVVREVYQGIFRRIMATHPLDYFWLWTPEGWQWYGNNIEAVLQDHCRHTRWRSMRPRDVGAPFKLATCGWVLGPAHDRAVFDADLPKDIPMSGTQPDARHHASRSGICPHSRTR